MDEELMEEELAELERIDQARREASSTAGGGGGGRRRDGRIAAAEGSAPKYDLVIKLLMLGDSGVGKTSLLQRYAKRKFDSKVLASAGVAYETQYVKVEGRVIRVDIWDTAGQERFHVITQAYYAGAQGIILAYDASDASETSFNNIRYWMNAIREHASEGCNKVLLGNKVDVPAKAISTERGAAVASEFGVKFFETSAKTGLNVDDAFQAIARDCVVKALAADGLAVDGADDAAAAGEDGKGKRCVVC